MATNAFRARFYGTSSPAPLSQYHLSEQQIAGLFATETCHPPGFQVPLHAHNLASFYLVLEGSLTEVCGSEQRYCGPQSMTFTPAGETHRNTFHEAGGRCFLVELTSQWDDRVALSTMQLQSARISKNDELTWLAIRLYKEFRLADSVSPLSVEGLGLEILGALNKQVNQKESGSKPAWLRRAEELIHDRYSETVLLSEIAAHASVHPVHLARSFRKHYGCSIGEYQRRLRVEHAAQQLRSSRRALAEIAQLTGFSDQAHFSRVFKIQTGLTPAKFRHHFSQS